MSKQYRQPTKIRPSGTNFMDHSLRITSSAVVGAWRLRTLPNGVAEELTSVGMNGTFANVTWPLNNHSPGGLELPLFNGTSSTIDLYSSALASAIDLDTISISLWARVNTDDDWTDSTRRRMLVLKTDANNYIQIDKSNASNLLSFEYNGQSTKKWVNASCKVDGDVPVNWMHIGLSVSSTELKAYFNGEQVGTTQTGIGVWSGALNSDTTLLGSSALGTPANVWSGSLSDLIIWKAILTDSEMLKLSKVS